MLSAVFGECAERLRCENAHSVKTNYRKETF